LIKDKNAKEKIVEYLSHHTKIDEINGIMKIESYKPSQEYIIQSIANEIGGNFIRRDDQAEKIEIEKTLIERRLLMNHEVELSEFTYDVKLY
jgi:hypothetical protein